MAQRKSKNVREDSVLRFLRVVHEHSLILREASKNGEVELQSPVATLTQVDAAERAGLSRPSVASYAQRMRGTVLDENRLAVRPTSGYALGVDLSDTHGARVALSDISGKILGTRTAEEKGTEDESDKLHPQRASEALAFVEEAIHELLEEASIGTEQVIGVGISLPGPVKGHNQMGRDAGIWRHLSAADELARRLGWEDVPFATQSDSYLSALAENMWGGEYVATHTLFVKWSAQLRSAIVIDGNLYVGHSGTAGELPHLKFAEETIEEIKGNSELAALVERGKLDERCPVCHERYCLHMVAPLRSISLAFTGEPNERASRLVELAEIDLWKRRLLEIAASGIGTAIAPLVEALDPESVIIGGALGSRAFPLIFEDLTTAISEIATRDESVAVRGGRVGEMTSVRGAVALALLEFAPQYLRHQVPD